MTLLKPLKKLVAAVGIILATTSCAHLEDTSHPLAGKQWDVAGRRFIDEETLAQQASAARFVLLGEIHDNKVHHAIQTQLLEQIVRGGRRPALVMEQYDRDQQGRIDAILNSAQSSGDKLNALRELMRGGWDKTAYEPLLRVAVQHRLPVVAANLTRDELRQVGKQGFAALGSGEEARLALETVWTPQKQERLVKDIFDGHCGKVPEHVAGVIAKAQRARDAVMADTMLKFKDDGAVAIVGGGHARRDMAVPLYLAARMPEASVLSLGIVQVEGPREPAAYAAGPFGPIFDYVWFTPRVHRRVDPCDTIPAPQPMPVKPPA